MTTKISFKGVNRFKRVWVAKILGPDDKYGLARSFLGKKTAASKCYYNFEAEIVEPGVYEVKEPGSHKWSKREYYYFNGTELQKLGEVWEGEQLPENLKNQILGVKK